MDELAVPGNSNLLEITYEEEAVLSDNEEKNRLDEELDSDYSTDVSDSELEIQIESISDSNKPGGVVPVLNTMVAADGSVVVDSTDDSTTADGSHNPQTQSSHGQNDQEEAVVDSQPTLNEEDEARADRLTTALLTTQLSEYSWIPSTVPEEEVREIVKYLAIKKDIYNYLPRVFYVDKEDFDLWKEKDGNDHFFKWITGNSRTKTPSSTANEVTHEGGRTQGSVSKEINSFQLYFCHREGCPRKGQTKKHEDECTEIKKRRVYKPSPKVGCVARLIVHDMKDDRGDPDYANKGGRKQLRVIYFYKHTGHILGDVNDFQHLQITEGTRARIRNLVRLGLCTRKIISKINLTGSQANSLFKQGTLKPDHLLKFEDVYNIFYKHLAKETQLAKLDLVSMSLWMQRLRREKDFTIFTMDYYKIANGQRFKKFAYGFMSPFQRSVYSSNHKQIGLDSTHGTNRSKHELYTIIIRDPFSLSAVPVAFLLTNDSSSIPLTYWFKHIKETIGAPDFITTDDAQAEYTAIRNAFGESVTVHLCLWHIMKAWSNKLRMAIRSTPQQTAKDLRQEAINELREILYNPYLNKAEEKIAEFRNKWSDHNDGKVVDYLDKRYFTESRKQRWMKAYRVGKFYAGMDTNNYVESWHNHLKSQFLKGHTNCRGDRLIFILSNDVDEFYQMVAMQNLVRRGRHTRGEVSDFKQLEFIDGKTLEELRSFVVDIEGVQNVYCVRSFSASGGFYFVSADGNTITGCNCQYFLYTRRPCRHMFVLHKVYQDNGKPPLSIIHHTINRTHGKHVVVEHGSSSSEIYNYDVIGENDPPLEEDGYNADDEINECTELLRKALHDSDSIVRSPEVARKIRKLTEAFCSLPKEESSSGVRKRLRQTF